MRPSAVNRLKTHQKVRPWTSLLGKLLKLIAQQIEPLQLGKLFEQLQVEAAGKDPRIGAYAIEYNNPQALCFFIDIHPIFQSLVARYPRHSTLQFLDIGPAFGAASGLIAQMYRSDFLGPRLEVSVLDITDERRAFIELSYPIVNFIHRPIEMLAKEQVWDLVYCSNAIEHLIDPAAFIEKVLQHTRGFALFLAPYMEDPPLSLDHKSRIGEHLFKDFPVEQIKIFNSAAWPTTAEGLERKQILAVLRGGTAF